jgi:hypothetical protein
MTAATAPDLKATVSATYRAKDSVTAIQRRVQDSDSLWLWLRDNGIRVAFGPFKSATTSQEQVTS